MTPESRSRPRGRLFVVATPIGNRDDLSARAIATLQGVDTIACEDTRHSAPLLSAIGSKARLFALHDHNEQAASEQLLDLLASGADLALISDAGTPLVSDPGFRLVQKAAAAGFQVLPIPGPSALIAALSVAGLATDRFCFEGFLPAKSAARRTALQALAEDPRTLVWFEAPHRIAATLDDAIAVFGPERAGVIARELTKTFETVLRGTLSELLTRVRADPNQQRGEIVLLIAGAPVVEASARQLADGERIFALLHKEMPASSAVRLAAEISGAPKNALYGLVKAF